MFEHVFFMCHVDIDGRHEVFNIHGYLYRYGVTEVQKAEETMGAGDDSLGTLMVGFRKELKFKTETVNWRPFNGERGNILF